mmetsp:Transcript_16561/g.28176  ORF Transcript_16561/g.28176 Transcript_16561/m.28176 type:complete len:297 (+) Transcript_16561:287-1177(+)
MKKKRRSIPIVRVDSSKKMDLFAKEGLPNKPQPSIQVYYDGTYYEYDGSFEVEASEEGGEGKIALLHFINRLLNPLVQLKSEEEIELFLDQKKEWVEKSKFIKGAAEDLVMGDAYKRLQFKTRVIAFFYSKQDYDEELNAVRDVARRLARREQFRIALVSDPEIIKSLREKTSWFHDNSPNALVLKRYDGEEFNIDTIEVNVVSNAYAWVVKKSIKEVEELNDELFSVYNMMQQPIAICYVDFDSSLSSNTYVKYANPRERRQAVSDSKRLVNDILPKVAKATYRGMVVTYVDINS